MQENSNKLIEIPVNKNNYYLVQSELETSDNALKKNDRKSGYTINSMSEL